MFCSCKNSTLAPVLVTLRETDFHFHFPNNFEDLLVCLFFGFFFFFFSCNISDIFLGECLLSTRELFYFIVGKRILRRKVRHKSCNHGKKKWKLKLGLSKLIKTHLKDPRTGDIFDIVKNHYYKKKKQTKDTQRLENTPSFCLFLQEWSYGITLLICQCPAANF